MIDTLLMNIDAVIEGILMLLGGGVALATALAKLTGVKVLDKIANVHLAKAIALVNKLANLLSVSKNDKEVEAKAAEKIEAKAKEEVK